MPDPITPQAPTAPAVDTTVDTTAPAVDSGSDGGEALDQSILDAWSDGGLDMAGLDEKDEQEPADPPAASVADTTVEDAPVGTPEAPAKVTQQEADDLAEALGLPAPPTNPKDRAKWWASKVNYSKVHKIVQEREKTLTDAHTAALAEHTGKIQQYEQKIGNIEHVEGIMRDNPVQFLEMLAQGDPRYADVFRQLAGQQQQQPADTSNVMPQPDYDMGNGNFTYSVEGLRKRDEWNARQVEARIMGQLSPLIKSHQESQSERWLQQQHGQLRQHIEHLGSTLPGFSENLEAIKDTFMADKSLGSMAHAYDRFMAKKNTTDHNKIRAEVVAEMKRIPKSTSAAPSTTAARTVDAGEDLDAHLLKTLTDAGAI